MTASRDLLGKKLRGLPYHKLGDGAVPQNFGPVVLPTCLQPEIPPYDEWQAGHPMIPIIENNPGLPESQNVWTIVGNAVTAKFGEFQGWGGGIDGEVFVSPPIYVGGATKIFAKVHARATAVDQAAPEHWVEGGFGVMADGYNANYTTATFTGSNGCFSYPLLYDDTWGGNHSILPFFDQIEFVNINTGYPGDFPDAHGSCYEGDVTWEIEYNRPTEYVRIVYWFAEGAEGEGENSVVGLEFSDLEITVLECETPQSICPPLFVVDIFQPGISATEQRGNWTWVTGGGGPSGSPWIEVDDSDRSPVGGDRYVSAHYDSHPFNYPEPYIVGPTNVTFRHSEVPCNVPGGTTEVTATVDARWTTNEMQFGAGGVTLGLKLYDGDGNLLGQDSAIKLSGVVGVDSLSVTANVSSGQVYTEYTIGFPESSDPYRGNLQFENFAVSFS